MSASLSIILLAVHVSLIALLSLGFFLAHRGRGTTHHRVMLTLYVMVVVYVPAYLVQLSNVQSLSRQQSPVSWTYYLSMMLAVVHIAILTGSLILGWQTIQIGRKLAKIGPQGHHFTAGDHTIHASRGLLAIAAFAGVALTGLIGDVFNILIF